jgi:hypothetical protein
LPFAPPVRAGAMDACLGPFGLMQGKNRCNSVFSHWNRSIGYGG